MEQEKMATASGGMKSALFKAVPGGWVFRSPNPWVFGDTPHYLVNDAQKAQVETILVPRRPAVVGALLIGGLLAWAIAVATFMWAFTGPQDPTPGDIGLMIVLIIIPLLALLPAAGFVQRRRLWPVLAGAPLTHERISYAEVRQNVRARLSSNHSTLWLLRSLRSSPLRSPYCFTSLRNTSYLMPMWRSGGSSRSNSALPLSLGIARFCAKLRRPKALVEQDWDRSSGSA